MARRALCLLLVLCLLVPAALTVPVEADFENTYVLTGNQRKDILGVALTQLGYMEGPYNGNPCGNDTKYGDWYGLPYNEWCAMFISWCARQADISESILQNSCRAGTNPEYFNITRYNGTDYTPQPGDLFFKADFSHVGLVYEVRGDTVITIEANVNYEGISEEDGFTVTFLERKISECIFGVPDYEGCDPCPVTGGDHDYTRNCDTAHPHANYFECNACGDKYYTGSNAHLTDCASCMSCSCDTSYAGFYKVVGVSNNLTLRAGHATNTSFSSVAELNQIVEVVAGNGEWAHIVDGPYVYYGLMRYLERCVPTPGNFRADADSVVYGEAVALTWDAVKYATAYQYQLLRDGTVVSSGELGDVQQLELQNLEPGNYQAVLTASHLGTVSAATSCTFRVLAAYTVTYDGNDAANVPAVQQKIQDQPLVLDAATPQKAGFVFLGWNDDPGAGYGVYRPGDIWERNGNVTLYAVWRDVQAVPDSLEIVTPAKTTRYFVGDALDTGGIELLLHYSDGTAEYIRDGFSVSGFTSESPGTVTVTLTCLGLSVDYGVEVIDVLPGDIDRSRTVNKEDVMQLLWHISFPDMFPIDVPADFTGDDLVDQADVMQLLWHISFPDMFPLM